MPAADAWERLWGPHRMAYLQGENKPSHTDAGDDCPFCRSPLMGEEDSLVIARGVHVYVVLNLYPYNTGHLMICPYRHVADYTELESAELEELATYTQRAMATLREVSGAQGFNIGINQGSIAGAGIAGHLHQHIHRVTDPVDGGQRQAGGLRHGSHGLALLTQPRHQCGLLGCVTAAAAS